MSATILDGNKLSAEIRAECAEEVKSLVAKGLRPGLAVVLVGSDPASQVYVRNKVLASAQVGIFSEEIKPPADITTEALLKIVQDLNSRDEIDGILVQLPLPKQINSKKVLDAIDPAKDVDGFHPVNVGYLSTQLPCLVPCTPNGCMEILKRSGIDVVGKEAVVIGRSDIVGKPMAMLLINASAVVTVVHSKCKDLAAVTRRADILVAAIGKPGFVTPEMVKPGAVVIDVGINRIDDQATFDKFFKGNAKREAGFAKNGQTLIGDCDPRVAEVASAFTPVPGGVGPLTIAMLMSNAIRAAKLRRGAKFGITA